MGDEGLVGHVALSPAWTSVASTPAAVALAAAAGSLVELFLDLDVEASVFTYSIEVYSKNIQHDAYIEI